MHRIAPKLVVALLLVGAPSCTPRGASAEQVAKSEVVEPVIEPVAAPAPAPAPTPPPVATPKPEPLYAGPPIPSFVLYTAEQTIIVPIDGSPRTIGEGLWVQDDRLSPPALTHTLIMSEARARTMQLPRCPCLALEGACVDDSLETNAFAADTGTQIGAPEQPCTCMHLDEVLGFAPTEIDGQMYEACMGGDDEMLASMVAGQLFYLGWDWNGACFESLSLYDAMERHHALITDSPDLTSEGMRSVGCDIDMGPAFVARPWPIDRATFDSECGDYFESQAFMLRRGDLWAVRDDISGVHGTRWYLKRAARPDSCPSVNDPCGDPQPFHDKAKLSRRQREFWIATDGSAALTGEKSAYALWSADAELPVEFELQNAHASNDVIGVRVHANVGPLRALIDKHPNRGIERPERAATTMQPAACVAQLESVQTSAKASELGNMCFMYIGIEQWSEAEAVCLLGLSVAEEPGTRGAILYNLGLIAEAQGAREQAGLYYRESLVERPGNRTVERKLAKLRLP
jgi:hypothetical protein